MSGFTQIVKRTFRQDRVPRSEEPCFETVLLENEQIIGIVHFWEHDIEGRATIDYALTAWVAVSL